MPMLNNNHKPQSSNNRSPPPTSSTLEDDLPLATASTSKHQQADVERRTPVKQIIKTDFILQHTPPTTASSTITTLSSPSPSSRTLDPTPTPTPTPTSTPIRKILTNEERQLKYDALEFTWNLISHTEWYKRYNELEIYKQKHGNINIPLNYMENPILGRWVYKQKILLKRYKEEEREIEEEQEEEGMSLNSSIHSNSTISTTGTTAKKRGILKEKRNYSSNRKNSLCRDQNSTSNSSLSTTTSTTGRGTGGRRKRLEKQISFSQLIDEGEDADCSSRSSRRIRDKKKKKRQISFGQLTDDRVQALERIGFEL